MLNVIPAGVNKLGYRDEICPVFMPLMGRMLASAFTVITRANPRVFKIGQNALFMIFDKHLR